MEVRDMSGHKLYFENLSKEQLATFFRELADRLDGVGPEAPVDGENIANAPDPGEFKKLKVGVKRDLGGFTLKWKSKSLVQQPAAPGTPPAAPASSAGEIKYKSLKKRMKQSFKAITETLMADVMPGEAVVTAFIQDSKLMMNFPDKGAEFYDEYDKALMTFANAFEAKDMAACKAAGIALNKLKKDCHSRYK
jgi:XXXCH domain-containing protein